MLILTRRHGETINIGDEVQVTVLAIRGNQVRIGVNAPKEIPVHRQEIYERIKKEKAAGGGDKEANGNVPDMGKVPESTKKPRTVANVPAKKAHTVHPHHHGTNLGTVMSAAGLGNK